MKKWNWDSALSALCRREQDIFTTQCAYTDLKNATYTTENAFTSALLSDFEAVAGCHGAQRVPTWPQYCLDGATTVCLGPLMRSTPLELLGDMPTTPELLRIKACLILQRNAQRDYVDMANFMKWVPLYAAAEAFTNFDILYPSASGESYLQQLYLQLATPLPWDIQPYAGWALDCGRCRDFSMVLFESR